MDSSSLGKSMRVEAGPSSGGMGAIHGRWKSTGRPFTDARTATAAISLRNINIYSRTQETTTPLIQRCMRKRTFSIRTERLCFGPETDGESHARTHPSEETVFNGSKDGLERALVNTSHDDQRHVGRRVKCAVICGNLSHRR